MVLIVGIMELANVTKCSEDTADYNEVTDKTFRFGTPLSPSLP